MIRLLLFQNYRNLSNGLDATSFSDVTSVLPALKVQRPEVGVNVKI